MEVGIASAPPAPAARQPAQIICGTRGALLAPPAVYLSCKDASLPLELFLKGSCAQQIYADSRDCWDQLPQYDVSGSQPIGVHKPLVIFLQCKPISGLQSYKLYKGQSGIYTCPREMRPAFRGDASIMWIKDLAHINLILESSDQVGSVVKIVLDKYLKSQKLLLILKKLGRLGVLLYPIFLMALQ